jgi:hypothetical protein
MKLIILKICVITIFLFQSCDELERSNPLDPKNPESESDRFVLIENFTNSSTGWPTELGSVNLAKLGPSALNSHFVILEHHIEKTNGTDPDALEESYNRYLELVPSISEQGLPDVFFDGLADRVQGASNDNSAFTRYKAALDKRYLDKAYFLLEPTMSTIANILTINVKIARLGSDDISDTIVKMILAEQNENRLFVRHISLMKAMSTFKAGTVINVNSIVEQKSNWDLAKLKAIVFIQDKMTHNVLQTAVVRD